VHGVDPLDVLALELALEERGAAGLPDPYTGLTQAQAAYCRDPGRRKVLTGGRRSGKTEAVVADLCATASGGGDCVYISLTRRLAKKTVWKRLKKRLALLGVRVEPNESELRLELPSGGSIELGGADDKEAIERYRGLAYALVVIDECGAHPSELLRALVGDVLRPALMDHAGRLVLAGTPSRVLSGYWAEQAGPQRTSKAPRWAWTIHDNPLFAGRVDTELAAVREENAWDEKSVSYRREYLGEWVQDDSVLCYPYDPIRNGVAALPDRSPRGVRLHGKRWRHVLGVDVGTVKDAVAIVVLASHPNLPDDYLVHAEQHDGMLVDTLISRIRGLLRRYPHAQVVLDDSGFGGQHGLELQNASLPLFSAKKTAKASAIRILHDRVLGGRFKLLTIPALDCVRKEWAALGWDDDHLQHHPEQKDHLSDAILYALRELHHWYTKDDMERPPVLPGEEDDEAAEHTWH